MLLENNGKLLLVVNALFVKFEDELLATELDDVDADILCVLSKAVHFVADCAAKLALELFDFVVSAIADFVWW